MWYRIIVSGCDDNTKVVDELTTEEYEIISRLAVKITENGGGCQPIMHIGEIKEGDYDHPNTVKQEDLPYSLTEAAQWATESLKRGLDF